MRRVAVTGLGAVCALGDSAERFWEACLAGETVVKPIPARWSDQADYRSRVWSPLPRALWGNHTSREHKQTDPSTLLASTAAEGALIDAGLSLKQEDPRSNRFSIHGLQPERGGTFIGTGVGGIGSLLDGARTHFLQRPLRSVQDSLLELADAKRERLDEGLAPLREYLPRFNPFIVSMLMPNAAPAFVGIKFSLLGSCHSFCYACAAGTFAIGHAFRAIRSGSLDLALAGGTEYLDDPYGHVFRGFDSAGTLARPCDPPEMASRPFDRSRSGFLYSQGGAGMLVLEDWDRARDRRAPVLAEIVGYGESFDGHSLMSVAAGGRQIERMIRAAFDDAGISPETANYINAHGTGTPANDEVEAEVLQRIFGTRPWVNSTKSLVGHTLGASGALEAVVTACTLRSQRAHVCQNLEEPVADLRFVRAPDPIEAEVALSHSFGFGGHNAGLVMRRATE